MFARNISIRLKSNSLTQFTETFDKDVLPLLRKQAGFRDAVALTSADGLHVTTISIWESREQAEEYNTAAYPDVVTTLEKVLDGPPNVRLMNVASSTMHKPAGVAAA